VEPAVLEEESALRDRRLRALADKENTRRLAEREAEDARKFAISSFASELFLASSYMWQRKVI
jgi:molecular chaperone GrpE